ncbi:Predicted metalloendopeptidase [Oscillospiraceae bacterium]|nr:Predicted metalloendopeptidase [Oscillospiraceae bacterium]
MKRRSISALALMLSVAMCGCTVVEQLPDATTETTYVQDISAIRAQDDFYGYINASYLMSLDVSDSQQYAGSFEDASDVIDTRLDEIIHEIVSGDRDSYAPGSNEQLIYDCYFQLLEASSEGSMMNEADLESFETVCDSVLNVSTIDEYLELSGELYRDYGVDPVFAPYVINGIDTSDSGAIVIMPFDSPSGQDLEYLSFGGTDAQSTANEFTTLLIELGMDPDEAADRGVEDTRFLMSIALETDLDFVKMLEEHPDDIVNYLVFETNDEIDLICPNLGHEGILKAMGFDGDIVSGLYILEEGQLSAIDSMLTEDNLTAWKDITLLSLVKKLTLMLPDTYGGYCPVGNSDWYVLRELKKYLASELGEEYVDRYYDEDTVEAVDAIAYQIRDEYVSMIEDCSWMSDEGKSLVIDKLMNMTFYIGASSPHEVDPSDVSLVGDSYYETYSNLYRKKHDELISKLNGTYESDGFDHMSPQTVNACYISVGNMMVIPLGVMQAPFYDPDASFYTNLGGIGAVIGHEISHAFDYHGMWYDASGNYDPTWMPAEDIESFEEISASFVDYYSSFMVMTYHNVDGDLTIGENMADAAGMACVLRLADSLDQKQEIFENYARIFAGISTRAMMLDQIADDPHSPNIVRVNATVALFDEFYEIYDVTEGDLMYIPESDRVRRW